MKITIILIIIFVDEKYSWRFILKMSVNALSIYGNYLLLLKAILRSSQYISIQYILSIFYHLFHLIETTFRTRSFVKFAFFLRFFMRYVIETFLFDENIWSVVKIILLRNIWFRHEVYSKITKKSLILLFVEFCHACCTRY